MQLFTALIIENFIMKWDKSASRRSRGNSDFEESHHFMSVHDMFRESLHEPTDEEILLQIRSNHYLQSTLPFTRESLHEPTDEEILLQIRSNHYLQSTLP
ncbi:two pore channel protein 2-like [Crassostrea virginica]